MIRYKDYVFYDYFINPETGVITNSKGVEKHQYKMGKYFAVSIHGIHMHVHCIQAHTAYGYRKGNDIHHIDENPLNNDLYNLDYNMTHQEHSILTLTTREITWEARL